MATPAQIKAALEKDEQEFVETPTRRSDSVENSRGLLESVARAPDEFVRGIPRGIANLAPVAADATDFARGRPSQTGDRMRAAMQGGPGGLPDFLNRPDSFAGRTGERFGGSLPFLAAGGPASLVGKGAFRNVLSEIVESAAGQVVEDSGGGGLLQFGAEATTGLGIGNLGRFTPSKTTLTNKDVKKLADKLGVTEKAILRARNIIVESDIPIDPSTGKPDIDRFAGRLARSVEENPDPNVRPSTRQAMSKVGDDGLVDTPSRIARRENVMAAKGGDFTIRLEGRKNRLLDQIYDEIDDLQPGGTFGQAQDAFVVAHDISDELTETAWRSVDMDSMPAVSTRELKKAALEVRARAKFHKSHEPSEVQTILDLPDEIPASDLQQLRSGTMRSHRFQSKASNADADAAARASNLGPILRQLRAEVDGLPSSGSKEYRAALEATRKHYEIFPNDSMAINALNNVNDGPKVVSKIVNSNDPEGEARILIRALEQTPRGADGFRQTVLDDLMNFGVANKTAGSMISRLRKKEGFYKEVLGPDQYKRLLTVVRRLRTAKVGSAATAGGAEKTQSALLKASSKLRGLLSFSQGGAGGNEVSGIVSAVADKIDDLAINKEVVREFMLDPESALIVLTAPDKKTLGIWRATADTLMTRALSRRALASEAAAAARSATPDQREFEQQQAELGAGQQPNGTGQ